MDKLRLAATVLFVLLVPVFLISSNVRWVINAPFLYSYSFDKYEYDITRYMDIERSEFILAAEQIRDYFNNDEVSIDVSVVLGGIRQPIFNEREVTHMKDVKGLVRGVYRIQEATGAYLLAFAVVSLVIAKRGFFRRIVRYLARGGMLTLAVAVVAGIGALVGFERLFLAFHLISFSNDFWQLDPHTDNLIAMFPEGFFFDATMWVAGSTVVQALLLAGVPLAIRRIGRRPAGDAAEEQLAEAGRRTKEPPADAGGL